MAQEPQTSRVLGDPVLETRPGDSERGVRQGDGVLVDGQQPCGREPLDEVDHVRAVVDVVTRQSGADRQSPRRCDHQAQQESAKGPPIWLRQPRVQLLGGLRDCPADASGVLVCSDGQYVTFAVLPGGAQGVGQERQTAWLVPDVAEEHVDEARLHQQTCGLRGAFDRSSEVVHSHSADEMDALLGHLGQGR